MKPLLIALGLCLIPAAAAAQPSPDKLLSRLDEADANGDGAVTRAELESHRAAQFERLDRNKDGVITAQERPRLAASRHGRPSLIEQLDTDKDGQLGREEFAKGPSPAFDSADTNGDGILTAVEREGARAQVKANR